MKRWSITRYWSHITRLGWEVLQTSGVHLTTFSLSRNSLVVLRLAQKRTGYESLLNAKKRTDPLWTVQGHDNVRQQGTDKRPPGCTVLTSIIDLVGTRQEGGRDLQNDHLQLNLSNPSQEDGQLPGVRQDTSWEDGLAHPAIEQYACLAAH